MPIECYFAECKHHGVHTGEEGPFCFRKECRFERIDQSDSDQSSENTRIVDTDIAQSTKESKKNIIA